MRESDLVDPELKVDPERFTVILRHRSIFSHQDIEWLEGYREFDLTKNEQRVVLLARDSHLLSTNEIIQVAGIVDIDDFRALYEQLRRKGVIYNSKPGAGGGGRRRDIGRFQVRPPRELEQFFSELIEALRRIAPAVALSPDLVRDVRSNLSLSSPYREKPDWSLQALGFVDAQKRFLPKALNYVPELEQKVQQVPRRVHGVIKAVKSAGYGFISADDGMDYFFHLSSLKQPLNWASVQPGLSISFELRPARIAGERDVAVEIRPMGTGC